MRPDNDRGEGPGSLLRLLQQEMETRGLQPSLVSAPGSEGSKERCARLAVKNPAAPEMGVVYVENDGFLRWERPADSRDADASKIAAEAARILQDSDPGHKPSRAAWSVGGADPSGPRELTGTREQLLVFLNIHWGRSYRFSAPETPSGQWTATARFGGHEQLRRGSAGELLAEVRVHYRQASRTADCERVRSAAGFQREASLDI
jgi:hypothetical protein